MRQGYTKPEYRDLIDRAESLAESKGHVLGEWQHEEDVDEESRHVALAGDAQCKNPECSVWVQISTDLLPRHSKDEDLSILFNEGDEQYPEPVSPCVGRA